MDDLDATLTSGERLLLCGLRVLAADAGAVDVRSRFERACGCVGGQAFRGLEVFVQQVRLHGRRTIAVAPLAACAPTPDERLMLQAFAHAQTDDYQAVDEQLAALIRGEPPGALGGAACLVADALAMSGVVLPVRPSAGSPEPRPATPPPSARPLRPPRDRARWPGRTSGAC